MECENIGRKRIYKNNAEKLRIFRLKKKKEQQLKYDGRVTYVRQYEDEKLLQNLHPELREIEVTETDISNMTEEQFLDYMDSENNELWQYWRCEHCNDINPLYREECIVDRVRRPEEYDYDAERFLEQFPVCKQWIKVKQSYLELHYGKNAFPSY
jgi:hypothetical protein